METDNQLVKYFHQGVSGEADIDVSFVTHNIISDILGHVTRELERVHGREVAQTAREAAKTYLSEAYSNL